MRKYGYREASQATKDRVPVIGDEILGAIASTADCSANAVDDNGILFLRNWAFADQFEAMAMDAMNANGDLGDDEEDYPCDGGCRQTDKTCVCAELESLYRHEADPATRGSWWVP